MFLTHVCLECMNFGVLWCYVHPRFVCWWLRPEQCVRRRLWTTNIPTMWHYVCRMLQPLIWCLPLLSLGFLVTLNTTSHLFDQDCDMMSKFLWRESGSKCLNPFTTKKFFLFDSTENLIVDSLKYSKIFLFQTKIFISHC